ncbi:hypothetical protein [Brevundimonas sp. SL161]|uniref:hypothetical protein n=1 Tax=Brevundimonas sp. SL161 TaxID=2804613 RepID=UPI003CF51416
MPNVYDQHQSAFARVSAFVILKDDERVATVALKFPADGAGRLWAYVHLIGVEMVRAHADGFGYDKRSAAVSAAIAKIPAPSDDKGRNPEWLAKMNANRAALIIAAATMESHGHESALRSAGFTVLQAV